MMKANKIDLLILTENDAESKEIVTEQEGSLLTIEQPQEKNTYNLEIPTLEIKKEENIQKATTSIPFCFFSHVKICSIHHSQFK